MPGLGRVTDVAVGPLHACEISGGDVLCWGNDYAGVLGDGTRNFRATPVRVPDVSGPLQISTGIDHACALLAGLLAGRLAGGWRAAFDPFGSAPLMALAGSTDPARAHLAAQGPTFGLATHLETAILAHAHLVEADPARHLAALDVLLALPPFTVVLGRTAPAAGPGRAR